MESMKSSASSLQSSGTRPHFDPSSIRSLLRHDRVNVLIGPNGAGKSTFLDTLSGELDASGHSTGTVLNTAAYQTQDPGFLPTLTVRQTVHLYRGLGSGPTTPEIEQLLHLINPFLKQKRGSLSGGQWRLVDIAGTCLLDREMYLFDEPLSGIDHNNARIVVNALCSLARAGKNTGKNEKNGRTVVVSLHDLALISWFGDPWIGDPWIIKIMPIPNTEGEGEGQIVRIHTGPASQYVLPYNDKEEKE